LDNAIVRSYLSGKKAKENFTGHGRDAETGMLYAGARYYMPNIGRWTSVDPLAASYPVRGLPCVRGLRYPVEMILELLSAGMSIEEILDDYEDLEREDILAVLALH